MRATASWVNLASSLDDAKRLSDVVIVGHVDRTESADDIVVPARGEPSDVDRVGAEIVRVVVDRTYKGNAQGAIQLFHTKLDTGAGALPAPRAASASPPANRATPPPPTETETRRVLLDGDPPYRAGEQYVLFLTQGPKLKQNGVDVPTYAVIAPEGRFLIYALGADRANSQLRAMTKRGFAPQYDGRPPSELFTAIGTPIAAGATPKPKNQAGRTNTIVAAAAGAAILGGLLASGHKKTPNDETGTTTATGAGNNGAVNPSTDSTRGVDALGIPEVLNPGSSSSDPANLPTFQTSTITLTWQPPQSSAVSSYLVAIGNSAGGVVTRYTTSDLQQAVRLPDGTYRWNVRAIDASGRQGRPAETRYFKIVTQRSVLR